jgi:hypothetical protein
MTASTRRELGMGEWLLPAIEEQDNAEVLKLLNALEFAKQVTE